MKTKNKLSAILNQVTQKPNIEKDWKGNDYFRSTPYADG